MSPITTHVLDTHTGQPGRGMPLALSRRGADGHYVVLASGVTNDDGRVRELLAPGTLTPGVYQMRFDTAAYFARHGTKGFYPEAVICFEIEDTDQHYHIPLLLSPFGYTTYRGS